MSTACSWAASRMCADSRSGESARSLMFRVRLRSECSTTTVRHVCRRSSCTDGTPTFVSVTQTFPIYQFTFPGGDTQGVTNFEYRIPIVGPVTLAAFFDAGVNRISLPGQLRLNQGRVDDLNSAFPQASFNSSRCHRAGHPKDPHIHRSGITDHDASGECALPAILGVQPNPR